MKKTNRKLNLKFLLIGSALFVFLFVISIFLLTPKLYRYPNLNSCFTSTVHKILLCNKSPKYTNLKQISKFFVHSVLVSEDDSFYLHKGIDWREFKISFIQNIRLKRLARGGSTVTQQLVKNAYLNQKKSIIRKLREIILAQQVEDKYSKSVILEKYLNIIELGTGVYGVKDAALTYFKKSPSELNVLESVYLSTLLPNPKVYSKSIYTKQLPQWQKERVSEILKRLKRRKRISETLYQEAKSKISLFPWYGLELNEVEPIKNDDLEFLNNLQETYLEMDEGDIEPEPEDEDDLSDKSIIESENDTNSLDLIERDALEDKDAIAPVKIKDTNLEPSNQTDTDLTPTEEEQNIDTDETDTNMNPENIIEQDSSI